MGDGLHRIAITGASGYVGTRLIELLRRDSTIERILALDLRSIPSSGKVVFLLRDVRESLGDLFAQDFIQGVIHLAFVLQPGHNWQAIHRVNVEGTANVLKACAEGGVKHILCLSSTTVYGAHSDNPISLTEESPVRPNEGFQYAEDKARVEELLGEFAKERPEVAVTILRGCVVMGSRADNFISRAFSKPFLVAVKGYDPPMQFIHEDDLVEVIVDCFSQRAAGTYNIAGEGTVPWSEMARLSGRRLITLPAPVIYGVTGAAWKLRLQGDSPATGLDFIRYPWVASTEKIQRELGVRFRNSSREALEAFLQTGRSLQPSSF